VGAATARGLLELREHCGGIAALAAVLTVTSE
jgi:hypothetical protein